MDFLIDLFVSSLGFEVFRKSKNDRYHTKFFHTWKFGMVQIKKEKI